MKNSKPVNPLGVVALVTALAASTGCNGDQRVQANDGAEFADLIGRAQRTDRRASDPLGTAVHAKQRAIAERQRRKLEGASLGAASLAHESCMPLIRGASLGGEGRALSLAKAQLDGAAGDEA